MSDTTPRKRDWAVYVPVMAAIIAGVGTAVVAVLNARLNLQVEDKKLRSSIILQAINTNNDTTRALANLRFFAKAKLIDIPDEQLAALENTPEAIPTLATGTRLAVDPQRVSSYKIFVQFAGTLARDEVRRMMQKLAEDWPGIQGLAGGGERTGAAAGVREIRYGTTGDQNSAEALAAAVSATGIVPGPLRVASNANIAAGVLEIWISK